MLPDPFTGDELDHALQALQDQIVTRRGATETIERFLQVAAANYEVSFPAGSPISERVLFPSGPAESRGDRGSRNSLRELAASTCFHGRSRLCARRPDSPARQDLRMAIGYARKRPSCSVWLRNGARSAGKTPVKPVAGSKT